MKRTMLVLAAALAAMVCGCGEGYSTGDRVGTITKFTHKGLFVSTWEGEMALGGLRTGASGAEANVWQFHAPDRLATKVSAAIGKGPVRVTYRQWAVSPLFQDSDYDLTGIEVLPVPGAAPGAVTPQ